MDKFDGRRQPQKATIDLCCKAVKASHSGIIALDFYTNDLQVLVYGFHAC